MLDSTRIEVKESSITSKKSGPKKGSIGYIVMHNLPADVLVDYYASGGQMRRLLSFYNSHSVQQPDPTSKCLFYKADVFFNRFGFEKNQDRCEHKKVCIVYPTRSYEVNVATLKNVSTMVAGLPTILAVPSVKKCAKEGMELKAYASSVLHNNLLKTVVLNKKFTFMLRNTQLYKNNKILNWLMYHPMATQNTADVAGLRITYENATALYDSPQTFLADINQLNSLIYIIKHQFLRINPKTFYLWWPYYEKGATSAVQDKLIDLK